MSVLEPSSGEPAVESLSAVLRAQSDDLSLYAGFLFNTLEAALPADLLTVVRRRGMRERLAKTEGTVVEMSVTLGDRRYTLRRDAVGAAPHATVSHIVGGVVLSSEEAPLDLWARRLAEGLVVRAGQNEAVRVAVARIVAGEDTGL